MAEYTDEEKVRLATQAHIDAGVLTLFHAFMTMHAMQNQTNKLIDRVLALEEAECPHCKHVEREHD